MALTKKSFGMKDGQEAFLYTLENKNGVKAVVTNYGAILVNLWVPDAQGVFDDVVLGFDTLEEYMINPPCFGATIGPSANRIAGAKFSINGTEYHLVANNNGNNLHSDSQKGYHKQFWGAIEGDNSVTFTLKDTDGNMGFPGNREWTVTYALDDDNALSIHYHGKSDKDTVMNPTNHSYFNLDGHKSGSIEEHKLMIKASSYTPVVAGAIPTGEIASVIGTPMDFTQEKVIGKDINADMEQLHLTGGFDHNWVVDDWNGELKHIATLTGAKSGRKMYTYTTLPGVQFYASNGALPKVGKDSASYAARHAVCLETQYYPNSINTPNFPSCVFGGEKEYDSVTVFRFE